MERKREAGGRRMVEAEPSRLHAHDRAQMAPMVADRKRRRALKDSRRAKPCSQIYPGDFGDVELRRDILLWPSVFLSLGKHSWYGRTLSNGVAVLSVRKTPCLMSEAPSNSCGSIYHGVA